MDNRNNKKIIHFPLTNKKDIISLEAGEFVYITGTIYTARDAAHKRLVELIEKKETLPFDFENNIVYYAGPSPTKEGDIVGSIGPTTSGRMDAYSPLLMDNSLIYMIGKGKRSEDVINSIKKYEGLYFAAVGGAGAYIAQCVRDISIIAFEDLGAEAIYKVVVKEMPVIVAIDSTGCGLSRTL